MRPSDDLLDPLIEEKLGTLWPVLPRDAETARRGRANFLAEAQSLAQAVSIRPQRRHNGWIDLFRTMFNRKESSPMLATLTSVLLIVSILLGGTGATVYAAQGSLPDQPLYTLKTLTENLRMHLNSDPEAQMDLDLAFVDRRVGEMVTLSLRGNPPPDAVVERLELHLNHTLQHAAGLDDERFPPAAERIQRQLQAQEQALIRAREQAASPAQAQLTRAQEMVHLRLRLVEDGLRDPLTLRERLRDQEHLRLHAGTAMPPGEEHQGPHQTQAGSGYGPGPVPTHEPAPGSGYGPGPEETAQPGSGYGRGPKMTASPDPGESYGPGPKNEDGAQTGKYDDAGPHPNEDPGGPQDPGPHPTDDAGEHHGPGPQPSEELGGQGGAAAQETQAMGPGGGGHGGRP